MIPRKNGRTNPLAGISPWTWVAASAMVGGLALMAAPAQAAVSTGAPASQASTVGLRGGDGLGGGFGGFGNRNDKGEETTDLFALWGADD